MVSSAIASFAFALLSSRSHTCYCRCWPDGGAWLASRVAHGVSWLTSIDVVGVHAVVLSAQQRVFLSIPRPSSRFATILNADIYLYLYIPSEKVVLCERRWTGGVDERQPIARGKQPREKPLARTSHSLFLYSPHSFYQLVLSERTTSRIGVCYKENR